MAPELMREIVALETFDRLLLALALAGVPVGLIAGWLWARQRLPLQHRPLGVLTGALCGVLLWLLYGLWRFYLWRIRIDLDKDFVGLHRVDVLVGNLVLFALVGAFVGFVARAYWQWLAKQLTMSKE